MTATARRAMLVTLGTIARVLTKCTSSESSRRFGVVSAKASGIPTCVRALSGSFARALERSKSSPFRSTASVMAAARMRRRMKGAAAGSLISAEATEEKRSPVHARHKVSVALKQ